ncbi:DNA repair protein REV1 [Chanos chanos]|uniref:DNA repair protein REV1 n=1 Tax=Chanos chanos TaxID=29144 RepID=A0A6J2W9U1_CHACN|nr:DNA repair protein REV1 [Chanos chanos]
MSRDGWRKKASEDDGWGGRGGYMAAKVCKLEQQFHMDAPREKQKEGASSSIFNGVAIYVNGYTDPSADELRRLMMLHGGQYHVYYSRSKTTHTIATNLPNNKIQELKGEKVVRPEWITDSIKAGRQLSYLQYQLYPKQKSLAFPSMCVRKAQEPASSNPSHPHQGNIHPQSNNDQILPSYSHPKTALNSPLTMQQQSNLIQHSHQESDIRLNGSVRGCPRQGEETPKVNGVHEETRDNPCPATGGLKESTLINGHAHLVNGALKPLDLAPHSNRPFAGVRPRSPQPHSPHLEHRDAAGPSRPPPVSPKPDADQRPRTPIACPSKLSNPQSAPHHRQDSDLPSAQSSVLPGLSTNQGLFNISEKSVLQDQTGRVSVNGSFHSVSPFKPTPNDCGQSGKSVAQEAEAKIISEFYSHSRLHHISTWRNEFSEYVNSLQSRRRAGGGAVFSGKDRLRKLCVNSNSGSSCLRAPQVRQSCILHVDMDCFFVSVGIRHRPDLVGKPVAVTSNRGPGYVAQRPGANPQLEQLFYQRKANQYRSESRDGELEMTPSPENEETQNNGMVQDLAALSMAEIASCSYEARQAGVRNGMFFGQAKQLCPELQAVPYDFQAYKEVALTMYETLASYTYDIEALSCDEALVDATALLAELGITPNDLASAIRADVKEKTGCNASVGMGSNILLARLATRKAKPNGQYFLRSEEVDDFIRDQPVTRLPGVGRSMASKLGSLGVNTCGDLQQVSMARLQREFGPRTGQTLFRFCRGLDDRAVRSEKARKSVSAEMNYNIRFTQVEEAESFLTNLSMEVQKRLQGVGLKGRRVTLKVMMRKPGAPVEPAKYGGHGICDNLARSSSLAHATDSGQLIAAEALKLFYAMKLDVKDMRGVGLQVQQLEGSHAGHQDTSSPGTSRSRSIRDLFMAQRPIGGQPSASNQEKSSTVTAPPTPPSEPMPGTSKGEPPPVHTPNHARTRLNFSIEVPSPSQVDRSVLEALPAELRRQVEESWSHRETEPNTSAPPLSSPCPSPPLAQPRGTLVLQLPNQPGQAGATGIVLELPDFSQVDPEVFAALPQELQEELRSAYGRRENAQLQGTVVEQRNALLQLKQPTAGRTKRRYKRRNASPAKKGPSPLKRLLPGNSPAKHSPSKALPLPPKQIDASTGLKTENGPSSSSQKQNIPEVLSKYTPRPAPTLAGACELSDIRTILREWVTTISEPVEEDILQVVRYCTELVEDKDLEKLDLVIKYMKRLMQQSVESVWSMAFDFILDNVQVVVQQTYGSTLKIT